MRLNLLILTTITMIAFAANSIFCRLALTESGNDPISFTLLRLGAGAIILLPYLLKQKVPQLLDLKVITYIPSLMLFSYALFFSLAYVDMKAATGALIVFPTVQFTMLGYALFTGVRLQRIEKLGVLIALAGLIYLLLPGLEMPPLKSSILMFLSGVSWGVYSILGKNVVNPALATAKNFIYNFPLLFLILLFHKFELTNHGMIWAILSGALTSAIGYLLWYIVLKDLNPSTAAIVVLSVPAIATFGGILFLNESISIRLILASVLILGGLYLKIEGQRWAKNHDKHI